MTTEAITPLATQAPLPLNWYVSFEWHKMEITPSQLMFFHLFVLSRAPHPSCFHCSHWLVVDFLPLFPLNTLTHFQTEELVKALQDLENAASGDAAVRQKIASLPQEVQDVSLLEKITGKSRELYCIFLLSYFCSSLKHVPAFHFFVIF